MREYNERMGLCLKYRGYVYEHLVNKN
jgi:hypothetical protein